MSKLVFLGDIVNYQPPQSFGGPALAGIVTQVYDDGTADLRLFGAYCAGTTDVSRAAQSDDAQPGTFFYPKGAKGAGRLAQPLNDTTDTTVALENGSDAAAVDDYLLIDQEYMQVASILSPNNLSVTRAMNGSAIAAHEAGAIVKLGVPVSE
jgi:hypothetical protein